MTHSYGQELHDKATRDISLNDTEKADLAAWYAEMDEAESKLLKVAGTVEAVAYMREQVTQMNARIRTAMLEVNEINAYNERLRQENLELEQRLRQKLEKQAA